MKNLAGKETLKQRMEKSQKHSGLICESIILLTIPSKPPIFNPSIFGFNLFLEYIKYI